LENKKRRVFMSESNDISIAIDILAIKLSKKVLDKKEMTKILEEKDLVLSGDKETIKRVIEVYGKEIREEKK